MFFFRCFQLLICELNLFGAIGRKPQRLVCGFAKSVRERRPIVVLAAADGYADDSYEQDGAYVLAGWVSTAPRWAAFSDDYANAGLPCSLHMKTVRRLTGARVRKLAELTQQHAAYRVDCLLHQGNYHNIVKGNLRRNLIVRTSCCSFK
jgi:hypothetical protein